MASNALTQMSINNSPKIPRVGDVKSRVGGTTNYYTSRDLDPTIPKLRTGFTAKVPDTIPSTALSEGGTYTDVRAKRDQMESDQIKTDQLNTDWGNLMNRINSPETPLSDPTAFLNRFMLNQPTDTQTQLGDAYGNLQSSTTDFAKDYGKAAESARKEFDIAGIQSGLADTRNQAAEKRKLLRETIRSYETNAERRGIAREFVDAEKQAITDKANAELADLAIIELAQVGNLTEAKASVESLLADKKQAFEFEEKAILTEISRLTQLNTQEAEKRADMLKIALDEKKARDDKALADEKTRLDAMTEAASNGADTATLTAIRNAKTADEAIFMASPFIGRLDRMQTYASIRASNASAAKNEQELADMINAGYSGEFSSAIDNASNLVGAERGKTSRDAITRAVQAGDYASAYSLIANNVEESLTGETKTKFANARTDYEVMSGLKDAIEQYRDAGGDTGFLKGTADQIARKFGQLKTDAKFATLAVQLEREFQSYRQNMTGAAFSPNESREYASVNPRTSATLDLNLATIDGALDQLENRVKSTVNARVPGADKIYSAVSGGLEVNSEPQAAPVGSIVEYDNGDGTTSKYRKVGVNSFEPI